jgi:hypothetical protein
MRPFALLVASLFTAPLLAAPVPKGIKSPRPLDGTWELAGVCVDAHERDFSPEVWVIDGRKLSKGDDGGRGGGYTLTLRPDVGQHAIDITPSRSGVRDEVDECEFALVQEGSILVVCYSTASIPGRPTGSHPRKGHALLFFKRVKGEKVGEVEDK